MIAQSLQTKLAVQAFKAARVGALPKRQARANTVPPFASLAAIPARPSVQRKCGTCASNAREEMPVQPRLEVGPVGDRYELEADVIAEQVMAMRDADVSPAAPTVQRACSACSADEPVRARHAPTRAGTETIDASDSELTSGGSPLPASTRGFFEQRMGHDLSDVRVHLGDQAQNLNGSIAARAFTYRNHVWLGAGEDLTPSFTMAHELAHVMQQTAPGPVGTIRPRRLARSRANPAPARVQRIAPLVLACIIGAVTGAVMDLLSQMNAQRKAKKPLWDLKINFCSVVISAILGCVGSMISAKYLEPWLKARFPTLAGGASSLIGRFLIKAVAATGMFVPKWVVKALLVFGCITLKEAGELGLFSEESFQRKAGLTPIFGSDYLPGFPPMTGDR